MGCRRPAPQHQLVRVVRTAGGDLRVGRSQPGRGAWLCAATTLACVDLATRRKAWERAFRAPVAPVALADLHTRIESGSG